MTPFVTVNCAASADGKIALSNRRKVNLSNRLDLERLHNLRAENDAILVGIETVLQDDPSLTIRNNSASDNNLIRIVLDTKFRTPLNARVMNNESRTIIATGNNGFTSPNDNVEILSCGSNEVDLHLLMTKLSDRGVENLLVEGGAKVIWSFFREGLVDKFILFVSSQIIGGATTPTIAGGRGFDKESSLIQLKMKKVEEIGDGVLITYTKK